MSNCILKAVCAFTYSFLDCIDNINLFILIAIVFRIIHGLASSLSAVLSKLK